MAGHGIAVTSPSDAEVDDLASAGAAVRAAADNRAALAFGNPAYAAANGYGIDWPQWQEVVMAYAVGGGGPLPELPPG